MRGRKGSSTSGRKSGAKKCQDQAIGVKESDFELGGE